MNWFVVFFYGIFSNCRALPGPERGVHWDRERLERYAWGTATG